MTRELITGEPRNVVTKRGIIASGRVLLGRATLLLFALSLGSCTFLADEFVWLNRAGPIAEPQDLPPSPIVDRG